MARDTTERPGPLQQADLQRVAELLRGDKAEAMAALEALPHDAQAALVCAAPLARRAELLGLLETPEKVIPLLPEAELCFTAKAIGVYDASWMLALATQEQIVACLDLDVWRGNEPDRAVLDEWLEALADTSSESYLHAVQGLDPEVVVMFLKHRIECFQKPDDDDGWEPPEGSQTLEGAFYFRPRAEGDDLAPIVTLLRELFTNDYWTYFRMLQGVVHELESDNEEWALRWRTGRLEDLGFPTWDRAMGIYRSIRPGDRAELPLTPAVPVEEWAMPVWVPPLPASGESEHLLFRTFARLDAEERHSALFALVVLANKIAVADGMPLGDAESTPRAIDKAATFASAGLEHIAGARDLDPVEVARAVPLERLFSVGANLSPETARPKPRGD